MKTVTITDEVADILRRATWVSATTLILPGHRLDRNTYTAVNKVLQALGGKWDRRARGHVFSSDAKAELLAALDQGHVVDVKKTLEQFFTPADLAARMVALARIRTGHLALEPSAGNGALCRAIRAVGASFRAYEIDDRLRQGLVDEFFPWLKNHPDPLEPGRHVGGDFMCRSVKIEPKYDAVIMNPPFSNNQDVRHVRKAWEFLRPGGRMVAVMSEHAAFSQNRESLEFLSFVDDVGGSFEPLPDYTFREAGTSVSTRLFVATKEA